MQKKLIALAVAAAASTGALAQTNVTISGEIKTQINQVSANGGTSTLATGAAVVPTNATARTRVDNGTSKLTFSGSEALGNGMKAIFQIDSDVGSDRVSGSIFGNRETYVGLSGNWGTFMLGRLNAHYNQMAAIDANGIANGLGLQTSSLNMFGSTAATTRLALGGRMDNVIAYATPNFNGFSGMFALVPGFGKASPVGDENTTAGIAAKERAWNLALKFSNGPIAAAYSLLQIKNSGAAVPTAIGTFTCISATGAITTGNAACPATSTAIGGASAAATTGLGTDSTSHRFGAAYTFPMGLKVGFIYDRSESETVSATSTDSKRTAWTLPMSYKSGAHTGYFTYGRAANLTGGLWSATVAASQTAAKSDARMIMLAYSYDLSKRTQLNASWTVLSNGIASNLDFWHGNTAVGGGQSVGADPTSLAFGMRHAF